jgi:hypothetical protein
MTAAARLLAATGARLRLWEAGLHELGELLKRVF